MKNKYTYLLVTGFIIGVIPLVLYFCKFHYELSLTHNVWGEFGALYGGVMGPVFTLLGFIGLLWNLDITKKQFREQSQDSTFYNLINLHNNKVRMTEFSKAQKVKAVGFDAFKMYSEEFCRMYDIESIRVARIELINNTRNLTDNAGEFLWKKYAAQFHENDTFWCNRNANLEKLASLFENSTDTWELQKNLIGTDDSISDGDREILISIGHVIIEDWSPENRIDFIKRANDIFYHEYGVILGHYFANIYYILEVIKKIEKIEKTENFIEYSKLFRAQLSRYELVMIYYNCISGRANEKFIRLVIEYDLFNGIYWRDICYFPEAEKMSLDLDCMLQQKLTKL